MLLESGVQQLEQPAPHDRAVAPDARDLVEVQVVLAVIHHLEAFGVGLHQPVLDPVVDHLHEVPRAARADVRVAVLGCERLQDRLQALDRLVVTTRHQAETDFEPPDPAGHADINEVDALLLRLVIAALRVVEVRVAAVDDRVAFVEDSE